MRFQVMSNLYLGFPGSKNPPPPADGVDAILVASDTCEGLARAVEALRRAYPEPLEIVTMSGNHELYSRKLSYADNLAHGREAAERYRVRPLERDACMIGSARILGCTMWTDYSLFGEAHRDAAMGIAATGMNDHRRISWRRKPWNRFLPQEASALHSRSRAWVECEVAKAHAGATLCLFHHPVTPDPVDLAQKDLLDAAYASDLAKLFESYGCDLVVSGYVHRSFGIRRAGRRFIANRAGYAGENTSFDPALVVEIPNG
jgi:hypothetical protein